MLGLGEWCNPKIIWVLFAYFVGASVLFAVFCSGVVYMTVSVIRALSGETPEEYYRPDWASVYRGVVHTPNRDNELVTVTRETARLALGPLEKQNEQDYYHNYGAAAYELRGVLGLKVKVVEGDD